METGTALQAEERPSLGETLSAAFDEAKVDAPVVETTTTTTGSSSEPVKDTPKVDATGRSHASDGKFAAKDAPGQATPSAAASPAAGSAPGATRPKRPDSWAKEYWDHWDKIDPALAEYLAKREGQYLQGVTTYKQEFERVKPIADALTPYQQEIQSVGGAPQFIKALADTHRTLSGQDPQAKLRAFARFAKDYQIPLEQLLIQGDDGKVYLNQQYFQEQQAAAQQSVGPQEIEKIVQSKLATLQLQQMVASFVGEKDEGGNPKYPHFEKVKASMDGLLRSGLVRDLPGAYQAALNLPQHSELADSDRRQREEAAKAADAKAKEDAAARARQNMISPKNQAPTALASAGTGKKGLRAALEDAANQHSVGGGRV